MKTQKGYTLLFAVIVSVLVLSIAAFILSVSRKQAILSASARDSVYAFYAADSGLECGIENLTGLTSTNPTAPVSCANNANMTVTYESGGATAGTSTFNMLTGTGSDLNAQKTQSGAGSCAIVKVAFVVVTNGSVTSTTTTVLSRGYNIGWNTSNSTCSLTGPRKVERAILYTQS
ncbi:MAG: hypothetical protein PHG25_04185 [Candidatus Pacebacteria bacterium]|nr:hypothetical protein [Candidatus Paceibacterota bacterium]